MNKEQYKKRYGEDIDKVLYDLYWNKGLSTRKIGKVLKIGKNIIPNIMNVFGVKIRSHSEAQTGSKNHRYGTKLTEKEKQYLRDKLSGEGNPRYGIILSEETKGNIGKGRKGKGMGKWTEERKRKYNQLMKDFFSNRNVTLETRDKISKSRIGKYTGKDNPFYNHHHTEEVRQKLHESNVGENNPMFGKRGQETSNWKNNRTPLDKKIRNSFKYRQWRSDIYTRDNFTCQECNNRGGDLHAHHKKYFSIILDENNIETLEEAESCEELWNINNGITLCIKHHKKIHKKCKELGIRARKSGYLVVGLPLIIFQKISLMTK